jgi:hypothetical protein
MSEDSNLVTATTLKGVRDAAGDGRLNPEVGEGFCCLALRGGTKRGFALER